MRSSPIGIFPTAAAGPAVFTATLAGDDFGAGALAALFFFGTGLARDLMGADFVDFIGVFDVGLFAGLVMAFDEGAEVAAGIAGLATLVTLAAADLAATGLGFSAGVGLSLEDPLIPRGMAIP